MRGKIEATSTKLAFVHMEPPERAAVFFAKYGLSDTLRFHDPKQALYNAFELRRSSHSAMFKAANLWRFLKAGLLAGHGVFFSKTDMLQMPGGFLFHEGRILKSYRHKLVSDRPDYCELGTV